MWIIVIDWLNYYRACCMKAMKFENDDDFFTDNNDDFSDNDNDSDSNNCLWFKNK